MDNIESCSLSLFVSVGYTCTFTNWRRIPPPLEKFSATAGRILVGAPVRPNLDRASRKSDNGAAEGSYTHTIFEQGIRRHGAKINFFWHFLRYYAVFSRFLGQNSPNDPQNF